MCASHDWEDLRRGALVWMDKRCHDRAIAEECVQEGLLALHNTPSCHSDALAWVILRRAMVDAWRREYGRHRGIREKRRRVSLSPALVGESSPEAGAIARLDTERWLATKGPITRRRLVAWAQGDSLVEMAAADGVGYKAVYAVLCAHLPGWKALHTKQRPSHSS
jgi:DNA-directed RNA polymerase specialized sigma24 family protein